MMCALPSASAAEGIGFFSPRGVDARFASRVDFAMINAYSEKQVEESIQLAALGDLQLTLDLGEVISFPRPVERVGTSYRLADGAEATKTFAPLPGNKLRDLLPDAELSGAIAPYIALMQRNPGVVDALFLVDEPYLNGVSRAEMERAGAVVRRDLDEAGLGHVRLGVIFASAMFDSGFARSVDAEAANFVQGADTYRKNIEGDSNAGEWTGLFASSRLATYDRAGNMTVEGGIPAGFEVIGFDYYISTLLLDAVYDKTLDWFAENTDEPACADFAGRTITELRSGLSFFGAADESFPSRVSRWFSGDDDALASQAEADSDRIALDEVFACRINATVGLLQQHIADSGRPAEILLIGESSSNGLLDFNPDGRPGPTQDPDRIQSRVVDEIDRYLALFARRPAGVSRLAFFTFDDEFDRTLGLDVGGVAGMPRALDRIFAEAAAGSSGGAP